MITDGTSDQTSCRPDLDRSPFLVYGMGREEPQVGPKVTPSSDRISSGAQPGTLVRADRASGQTFLRRELSGRGLLLARVIVAVYGSLLVLVYLRWLPRWIRDELAIGASAGGLSGGGFAYRAVPLAAAGIAILATLAWIGLAVLVFLRRSRDLFGLLLSASFLSIGIVTTDLGGIVTMERSDSWGAWPAAILIFANGLSLPWLYCFPDGRFVPRWTVGLAGIWLGLNLEYALGAPGLDQTFVGHAGVVVLNVAFVTSVVALGAYKYWRRSTAVQRQQGKWLLLGSLFFLAVYLLVFPTGALVAQVTQSGTGFLFHFISSALFSLGVIAIPLVIGIAIFRQGLLDIDLLINRTLTYVAITVILAIGFVAISAVSNWVLAAVTGQRSEFVLLASVVPVALAFTPIRAWALNIADRFVSDRKVMTLLFLDIVGSTTRAYALGDRAWRELLERFRSTVRRGIKRYGGKEIDTTGDGFFITFEGPDQALRCAHKLIEAVRLLGLEIRVGVHIGEVQVDGHHVEGANVHLAARVMSEAGPSEVLVSRALRDVIAGSEIELRDRGARALKGVPGDVQLFAALA